MGNRHLRRIMISGNINGKSVYQSIITKNIINCTFTWVDMIKNSFIFLEKIQKKREQSLWRDNILNWNDFLKQERIRGISPSKKQYFNRRIREAQQALLLDNSSYFIKKLPKKEMWRLYGYFKDESAYLDIETDSNGKVILVGISDYYNSNSFVYGYNLEKEYLQKELSKYKILVTFNGSSFDLPKLKKQLDLDINIPHIDLKPLVIRLGLNGGLKEVEKTLNLKRPANLYGNPVDLWKAFHASGEKEWLELLIDYNKEDVENLKLIIDFVYKELTKKLS